MHIPVTEFIGRHLPLPKMESMDDFKCAMCGQNRSEGVRNAISKTFTDYEYLKSNSGILCRYCAACIGRIQTQKGDTFFRNFSFLCTETELRILKSDDIMPILIEPPEGLYVLCVSFSNKKHIAFKARVNFCKDRFIVSTDKGNIYIDKREFMKIYPICQAWYTIVPGKEKAAMPPTWFTKDDILHGCTNAKRISDYGIVKYAMENNRLEFFRRSMMLKLIVHALRKVTL
jgi:CRISPR type IV-associated protein Csf1